MSDDDYEAQRQKRIQQNAAKLAELQARCIEPSSCAEYDPGRRGDAALHAQFDCSL